MGFLDETANILGLDEQTMAGTFCYVSPTKGMVVEGYKKIYELSTVKIILLCEDAKKLEIKGKDLKIKEIAHREISVVGNISSIEFS